MVDPLVQMRLSPPVLDDLVHVGAGVEEEVVPPLLEGDVEAVVVVKPCHKLLGLLSSDVDPEVVERNFDLRGGDPATLVRVHLGEHEMELPFMPEQWWLVKFWDSEAISPGEVFNELLKREISRFGSVRFLEEKFDLVGRDVSVAEVLQSERQLLSVNPPIPISVQLVEQTLERAALHHRLHLLLLHHHPRHHQMVAFHPLFPLLLS